MLGLLSWIIVFLFFFLIYEKQRRHPLIDMSLFKSAGFCVALLGTLAFGTATSVVFIVPPFFLEGELSFQTWQVGLISLFAPLGVIFTVQCSGKFINKWGAFTLMLLGLLVMVFGLFGLSMYITAWPIFLFCIFLFIYGLGGGIFQPPNIHYLMNAAEETHQSTIGAINRMVQNIGIALGASISAAFIYSDKMNRLTGIYHSWLFALFFILLTLFSYLITLNFSNIKATISGSSDY
jgi:predicted MFS family arabinose efflux permease